MFHLVCVHAYHGYTKGQIVTDPAEVEKLMQERDHHFVRISAPEPEAEPETDSAPSTEPEEPIGLLPSPGAA